MIEELNTLEKDVEPILLNNPYTRADGKETKTCRVVKGLSEVSETIRPLGNYSMCPLLRA